MAAVARAPVLGVFDSGVGGLSVLRALRAQLPAAHLLYVADQAHIPYGRRSRDEIVTFAHGITRFLLNQGAEVVVVACNTATAAAIDALRASFPQVPFVGIEPAIKPAARKTRSGVIGVLATQTTFRLPRYAALVQRFARPLQVLQDPCPGLVERIEAGDLDGPAVRAILKRALGPMLRRGADVLVLGCTHYPFVEPLLRSLVGPRVAILDPAPAVARRAAHLLRQQGRALAMSEHGRVRFFTTATADRLANAVTRLLGWPRPAVQVLRWQGSSLRLVPPPSASSPLSAREVAECLG